LTLTAKNIKKSLGFTLIEILIGIVISTIMMAAMFTTYNVVNNTYSQVSDVASISRAGRDVVSMMMRDVRMAGFKYYYGVFAGAEEDIPAQDYLQYVTGDTEATKYESHAPIIIYKDTLNYKEIDGYIAVNKGSGYKGVSPDTKITGKDAEETKSLSLCCDRIHIVYGDFDANTEQQYKKYRISYFALPMEKMSGSVTVDKYYAIYRSKESWIQPTIDDPGRWITEESDFCPDCYRAELMREYLVDMEFIALDRYGEKINTDPAEDHNKLYDIRSVDIKLTFRSSSPKGYFKRKIKNVIKSFDEDRMESITDSFHRESIFVTVHTRNIGEPF
tara:strand:- start:634 stop:1629 length:996 start_codon:yes stop_codon:yes gene_type:complete